MQIGGSIQSTGASGDFLTNVLGNSNNRSSVAQDEIIVL